MPENGILAKKKGKELELTVAYLPHIGYFIGTIEEVANNSYKEVISKESIECFNSYEEALESFNSNSWEQATVCNLN